jgi:hypothetical protein
MVQTSRAKATQDKILSYALDSLPGIVWEGLPGGSVIGRLPFTQDPMVRIDQDLGQTGLCRACVEFTQGDMRCGIYVGFGFMRPSNTVSSLTKWFGHMASALFPGGMVPERELG